MAYTTLALVQAETKAESALTNPDAPTVIAGNEYLLAAMPWVSNRIETLKGMPFAPRRAIRWFDAPPDVPGDPSLGGVVILDQPLAVPVAVRYADSVLTGWQPPQAFASQSGSDYYLYPIQRTPYQRLIMAQRWRTYDPFTAYGAPSLQVVQIDGLWCWRTFYAADAWLSSGAALAADVTSAALTLAVSSASAFSPGMWIRFADAAHAYDDEISEVVAVTTAGMPATHTLTLAGRGDRGTTATAHLSSAALDIFMPEPNLVRAATRWVATLYERRAVYETMRVQAGAGGSVTQFFPPDAPGEVTNILSEYMNYRALARGLYNG